MKLVGLHVLAKKAINLAHAEHGNTQRCFFMQPYEISVILHRYKYIMPNTISKLKILAFKISFTF